MVARVPLAPHRPGLASESRTGTAPSLRNKSALTHSNLNMPVSRSPILPRWMRGITLLLCLSGLTACAGDRADHSPTPMTKLTEEEKNELSTATFGAGCFWCVEAVFERLDGVKAVESGYMGGETPDPTYREVSAGATGHAEVVQIHYDPEVIDYGTLLDWLWRSHDPTTLNRQGADVGTQYRSAIFYHDEAQRETAKASKAAAQDYFEDPIVTEITPASTFYLAEGYHQDYYRLNASAPYCQMVIRPKLKKLELEGASGNLP